MITSFDYFFGGHIEMEQLGFAGIPIDDRDESDENLATVFDEALSMAELMERNGFDTLWLAEHHFQNGNRSGPWVMRPGERGSRWAYRDTAVSWGRSEGAGWW